MREILDVPACLARRARPALDRYELGGRFEHLVSHCHLRLQLLHQLEPLADVGAQLFDGVELARFVDPFVGEVGQHLLLRVLHEHAEVDRFAGALAEPLGELGAELEDRLPGRVPRR